VVGLRLAGDAVLDLWQHDDEAGRDRTAARREPLATKREKRAKIIAAEGEALTAGERQRGSHGRCRTAPPVLAYACAPATEGDRAVVSPDRGGVSIAAAAPRSSGR
jgi:hypothetical protein